MGRFVREQLVREGVDVAGLTTDPARLTALVILGIRDRTTFPLIFYRENCADMALEAGDMDEAFIASARAIVVTGTHFSTPQTAAASRRAMAIARQHGRKVVFDIDYRPVLWGLTGHGLGESRFIDNAEVTARLLSILRDFTLYDRPFLNGKPTHIKLIPRYPQVEGAEAIHNCSVGNMTNAVAETFHVMADGRWLMADG